MSSLLRLLSDKLGGDGLSGALKSRVEKSSNKTTSLSGCVLTCVLTARLSFAVDRLTVRGEATLLASELVEGALFRVELSESAPVEFVWSAESARARLFDRADGLEDEIASHDLSARELRL